MKRVVIVIGKHCISSNSSNSNSNSSSSSSSSSKSVHSGIYTTAHARARDTGSGTQWNPVEPFQFYNFERADVGGTAPNGDMATFGGRAITRAEQDA